MKEQKETVLITGTGRAGTTFLVLLFTFMGFDTGYTIHNYQKKIYKNCGSGLEFNWNSQNFINKNPQFISKIKKHFRNSILKL